MRRIFLFMVFACGLCCFTNGQDSAAPEKELSGGEEATFDLAAVEAAINERLNYQTGTISIGRDLATLDLPDGLRFLDGESTRFVVEELWGNPPGSDYLGMILPVDKSPIDDDCVSAIITYEDTGHISDDDAASIDYDQLLKDMQSGEAADNAERSKLGYETAHIVGWAKQPRYDAATNKLFWAKEISFSGSPEHILNYSIRALGRVGVLELNFVGTMQQLGEVDALAPKVLDAVAFNSGNKYSDFNASTDKVAGYGIAALVAGGVAAKVGLFKGLWLAILAFKKFIIIGVIAAGAFVAKLFGRRSAVKSE